MLLKWILLLIIAWYVSKAMGNIIFSLRGPAPVQPIPPRKSEAESKTNVHKSPASTNPTAERREVEDARFIDL